MKGIRFIPENTNINFIGMRFIAYIVSAVIILGSIGLTVSKGLNFGIDFTGGTVIEIKTPDIPDLPQLRNSLNALGLGSISIQEFGEPDDLLIRMPEQKGGIEAQQAAIDKVKAALDASYPAPEGVDVSAAEAAEMGVDYRRTEFVGPQVGKELKRQGLYAVLFSMIGMLIYIWFRFEWQFGVAAVVALLHDSIATIGLFAFTQMEFNLATVAAILTIAGYSINDTVVVFDRVRENLRKYKKKALDELLNNSINQMLTRTLMTSVTTLIALSALYVFGGEVIRGFIYALIFGVIIGTYSSNFVASPILLYLNVRRSGGGEKSE